jgi:hypothetical protein
MGFSNKNEDIQFLIYTLRDLDAVDITIKLVFDIVGVKDTTSKAKGLTPRVKDLKSCFLGARRPVASS